MIGATPLLLAAAVGAVCLALAATFWALAAKRAMAERLAALTDDPPPSGWADAFDTTVISVENGRGRLIAGEDGLAACADALRVPPSAQALVDLLTAPDHAAAKRLQALFERGEACDVDIELDGQAVELKGRTSGVMAWLKLRLLAEGQRPAFGEAGLPALLDAQPEAAWVVERSGRVAWANPAWLALAKAATPQDAEARGSAPDFSAEALVSEAQASGQRREGLRWTPLDGERRAFRIVAEPLSQGATALFALDVTEAEETREALKLHSAAHDDTLNRLADAVAIFTPGKRLSFHNTAFAELWSLEPAWLAEQPSHGEILDRLRQRRRLPETIDYAQWKAGELAHYEDLTAAPDDLWTLPDGRTLRVVRQPHPLGGLLLLFSDVTGELKLKAQYNALIQVQQATLDKLSDAVAVFGSDGRLRLHNEAFGKFWNLTPGQLDKAGDFDGVAELCLARLHDLQFWRDLKARVGDPDPQARVAVSGETRTSDQRIISYQSRPLPDGATLIAFTDVTDARSLERALADREAALSEAENLKRDFVGNVSYELRTPLTTILGYSELLDHSSDTLSDRGRSHVAAVRMAASQLARSIDDVLDMAQIDAGEMALDLGDVDVASVLDGVAERWAREAADNKVRLVIDSDPDVGLIRGDRKRLDQILDHLTENALRQSPAESVVTLAARRTLGEVQVQVSDTGRGIPFHVQAHIFDRFVGRDRGGPGLGLALVKALVELHGGWVALESEPGQGATFTCHLPETARAAAGQPELQLQLGGK